VREREK
jgi:hypothetical protein